MKKYVIACVVMLLSLGAAAQEQDSAAVGQKKSSRLVNQLRRVQNYLDSAAKRKVDPRFIEVPDRPWRVILRYKESAVNVDYENNLNFPEYNEYSEWKLSFKPPVAASVGVWVGYRGTGISYSYSLAKNSGRNFSISTTGAKYGFNFRLRRFSMDDVDFTGADYINGKKEAEVSLHGQLDAPVWIRSVYANGYYVLNGRHYSQAAAYNQSVIQRRSAGSFLVGATWYQSSFDFSDKANKLFIFFGNNVNRIKLHQANIGVGYGYNWVPFRGFVVNAMAMPTISVYNRVKVYKYKSNYDFFGSPEEVDDYGEWNPETHTWANGKEQKPLEMDLTDVEKWYGDLDLWGDVEDVTYSMLKLNVDLRVGIAYNWKDWFVGLQAQFNNFNYTKEACKVNLFDAWARFSLGMRL